MDALALRSFRLFVTLPPSPILIPRWYEILKISGPKPGLPEGQAGRYSRWRSLRGRLVELDRSAAAFRTVIGVVLGAEPLTLVEDTWESDSDSTGVVANTRRWETAAGVEVATQTTEVPPDLEDALRGVVWGRLLERALAQGATKADMRGLAARVRQASPRPRDGVAGPTMTHGTAIELEGVTTFVAQDSTTALFVSHEAGRVPTKELSARSWACLLYPGKLSTRSPFASRAYVVSSPSS